MDLDEAVRELYGTALEDFVATRTRLAKGADPGTRREITALRKPTVTAWLLNQLVRERPDLVDAVGALGTRMRTAQAKGDMAALRAARPERDALVARVVAGVHDLATARGRSLSAAGEDEVGATVVAALADEQSQAALASGMLVRTLSYSGFGEVDLDDAVADRARLRVVPGGGEGVDTADEAALTDRETDRERRDAELRLQTAEAEVALVEKQVALAEEEVALADEQVRQAEATLASARQAVQAARTELRARTQERDAAGTKVAALRRGSPAD